VSLDRVTVYYFVALIIAVILHEISHGVVALWFGDDTAKRAGRLTLNPVPHIDPFGSIIMPALGALAHVPVIAWAKPVPVNPNRLRNRRRDMLFVSLAGPTTNFVLAAASAVVARALYQPTGANVIYINDLPVNVLLPLSFAAVNLFLGVFNFLPIPPLDGASLIERVLPERWLPGWYKFRPYGILVLFILVFSTPILDKVFRPFLDHLYSFVLR
jgi:Zn-dependent protease